MVYSESITSQLKCLLLRFFVPLVCSPAALFRIAGFHLMGNSGIPMRSKTKHLEMKPRAGEHTISPVNCFLAPPIHSGSNPTFLLTQISPFWGQLPILVIFAGLHCD